MADCVADDIPARVKGIAAVALVGSTKRTPKPDARNAHRHALHQIDERVTVELVVALSPFAHLERPHRL